MSGGTDLLSWLASLPADARDAALEERLGIRDSTHDASLPPAEHLLGYHASGVAPIVQTLAEVPVTADDVVIDMGSGLGKVVFLAQMLTGATARGLELQPQLVDRASAAATRLGVDVRFRACDVREATAADLDDGTVFYLYVPFTGPVLTHVLSRLHDVAKHHAIVVCALGVELGRAASWLSPRALDSFWLTLYDSAVAGVSPRPSRPSGLDPVLADKVARAC